MDAVSFARSFVPLQLGDRAGLPDFVRLGAWAACDASGKLLSHAGDPALPAYLRSSAKPFQAIAFLRRGLDESLGLTDVEVACACASHEAQDVHVAAARRILGAAGIDEGALLCGTHPTSNRVLEKQVIRGEVTLSPIHNNCSGKHSAMLATCKNEGWPLATYTEREHPLQRENLATLATFAGVSPDAITVGVDNCTVPTFALPLKDAARAFARLLDPVGIPADLARAGARAVKAMTSEPELVGGAKRLDTLLMRETKGRVVAKTGANGYYAAAGRRADSGDVVGFALKLAGAEAEAQKAPCCIQALRAVGLLSSDEASSLLAIFDKPQLNCRGAQVGDVRWVGPER